jgi:hypothetical protein
MTEEKKTMNHNYTVELRFSGDQLEPSEISARLGLQPSFVYSQSQNLSSTRKRRPCWGYNGQEKEGYQIEWASLEDGFIFLFKILNSKKSEIIALSRQFDGVWWCGHFQASFDGGPKLSSEILAEIANYGIPLYIDNYFVDDSERDRLE